MFGPYFCDIWLKHPQPNGSNPDAFSRAGTLIIRLDDFIFQPGSYDNYAYFRTFLPIRGHFADLDFTTYGPLDDSFDVEVVHRPG